MIKKIIIYWGIFSFVSTSVVCYISRYMCCRSFKNAVAVCATDEVVAILFQSIFMYAFVPSFLLSALYSAFPFTPKDGKRRIFLIVFCIMSGLLIALQIMRLYVKCGIISWCEVQWTHNGIPISLPWPDFKHGERFTSDPLAGFLPPNVNPPEEDGSVVFTVMPKEGLPTGTSILNKATIVFDVNDPIETPEWFNLLDNTKPQSAVNFLPSMQPLRNFELVGQGRNPSTAHR